MVWYHKTSACLTCRKKDLRLVDALKNTGSTSDTRTLWFLIVTLPATMTGRIEGLAVRMRYASICILSGEHEPSRPAKTDISAVGRADVE